MHVGPCAAAHILHGSIPTNLCCEQISSSLMSVRNCSDSYRQVVDAYHVRVPSTTLNPHRKRSDEEMKVGHGGFRKSPYYRYDIPFDLCQSLLNGPASSLRCGNVE